MYPHLPVHPVRHPGFLRHPNRFDHHSRWWRYNAESYSPAINTQALLPRCLHSTPPKVSQGSESRNKGGLTTNSPPSSSTRPPLAAIRSDLPGSPRHDFRFRQPEESPIHPRPIQSASYSLAMPLRRRPVGLNSGGNYHETWAAVEVASAHCHPFLCCFSEPVSDRCSQLRHEH